MGHASICYACQTGILRQDYPNCIYCESCGAKWYNNYLGQSGKNLKQYYATKYKAGRS